MIEAFILEKKIGNKAKKRCRYQTFYKKVSRPDDKFDKIN